MGRTEDEPPVFGASKNLIGTTVGRFVVRARLGAGGQGEVYRADDPKLKRWVALKRLAPRKGDDPRYHRRLLKEGARASALNHPNIASVYDVLEEKDGIFLVMEYVEGETLRARLSRPISIEEFFGIAVQCADALAAAHARAIVHGDVKPENIMLMPVGLVKILDFGVAKRLPVFDENAATESLTDEPGMLSGTPAYMAPEVLLEKRADGRADIFALGVVLYEMLAGRHPFLAGSFTATTDRILHEVPPLLRETNPNVPAAVETMVARMLAKDPAERFATARDLAVDLRGARGSLPPASLELTSRPSPPKPQKPRWRLAAALVFLGLAICGVSYEIWRHRQGGGSARKATEAQPLRSIAILPFRNIGGTTRYDYFGVGLADVLNAKLTNARFLEVRSPYAVWNLPDPKVDPLVAGRRLGVEAVLSGSYQIEAGMVSVDYTLTDVRRNVQIAGDSLNYPFGRAIEVEHRLASAIVDSLKVSATPEERARFIAAPTHQNEAFQAYLRSNYEMEQFWRRPSAHQLSLVEQSLNAALRVDPQFTLALISLAKLRWISIFYGYASDPKVLDRAEQEADQAITQDPNLADAYAAKALVRYQRGQLDGVRDSLREAFARSPHSALAYYAAGFYYMGRGLPDWSVRAFRRARELDPELVRRELGFAYRYAADFVRAEQQLREDLQAHPDDLHTAAALAGVLVARGNLEEAGKIADHLLRQAPDDPLVQYTLGLVRVSEGKEFSIPAWLHRYHDTYWSDAGACIDVAGVYAIAQQFPEALRWLRRASELGIRNYVFLSGNPLYANLRQDPEFQSYLESIRREWEDAKRREQQDPLIPADGHESALENLDLDDRSRGALGPTPAAYNTDSLAPSTPRSLSIFWSDRAAVQKGARPNHVATRQNV
jgi:eukaryotic-like serine/threonine-protein kinase